MAYLVSVVPKTKTDEDSGFAPNGASAPTGALALADGTLFHGIGFGHQGMAVGEVCFNTAMSGYQEILTDPSYYQQIVVFTAPHIGNTGINDEDDEGQSVAACAAIQRCVPTRPSNYRSTQTYPDWLAARGVVGLAGIDTRALTLHIREHGMQGAAVLHKSSGIGNLDELQQCAKAFPSLKGAELAIQAQASTPNEPLTQQTPQGGKHIVIVDFGVKQSILQHLSRLGLRLTRVRADTDAKTILDLKPDGIILSNGPGDPAATARHVAPTIRALLDTNIPLLAICLGHQILALSMGGQTRKMAQGHHGANHPVQNLQTGCIEVTSMNHGFTVDPESLPKGVVQTHVSLFDGTNCGLSIEHKPVLSVQHHPEAGPGPNESSAIFSQFAQMVADNSA